MDAPAPRPRPAAQQDRRVPQPGDRICGNCGEANDPARRFCRKCGSNIVEAALVGPERVSWWRRIFRRQPKTYSAGERAGRMQVNAKAGLRSGLRIVALIRAALAVIVVLGVVGYIGVPSVQKLVNDATGGGPIALVENVRRMLAPRLEIERPVGVTASSEAPDHRAVNVFDTNTLSFWSATGGAPSLTIRFKEPVDLGAIVLYIGTDKDFTATRRPERIELRFEDGRVETINLQDVNTKQEHRFDASGVESLELRVVSTNGPDDAPLTISEIEFFRKS